MALLLAGMTPTAEAQSRYIDYDLDDDGLIEIRSLEQLQAMHYSYNGNNIIGGNDSPNLAAYDAAFPRRQPFHGPTFAVKDADGKGIGAMGCLVQFGFCDGYELTVDLDFDTNGDGEITEADGDISWNGGKGWLPVGGTGGAGRFDRAFVGNSHTISNMWIRSTAGQRSVGLFGDAGGPFNHISGVALLDVDIEASHNGDPTGTNDNFDVGGLVGLLNQGKVRGSYTTGTITVTGSGDAISGVGGLVGRIDGNNSLIAASWSAADVSVTSGSINTNPDGIGGLLGIAPQRATGHATVTASYARGNVSGARGFSDVGGLIGGGGSAQVRACYATGQPTNTPSSGANVAIGGLIAVVGASSLVADSYWDTQTSMVADDSDSPVAVGKTTTELQAGTGTTFTGDFTNWNNLTIDASGTNDDSPWELGTSSEYPSLLTWHQSYADPDIPPAPPAPPVARAGEDINTFSGQLVTLDGSASAASAGAGDLAYEWLQVWSEGSPYGLPASHANKVTLSDDSVARPTFTAPETVPEGGIRLTFKLEVHDGTYYAVPPDWVTVTVGPAQPNQLTELSVTAGGGTRPLTPAFVPATPGPYRASVGAYTTTARVALAAAEEGATIAFDDRPVKLDEDYAGAVIVHLAEGSNRFVIVVTPPPPDPEAMPEPTPTDPDVTPEPPLEPTTYYLTISRQPVPRLKFAPARLLMDEGATATYTVDLDTKWLGSEVTVVITSGDPDVTVAPDTVSFRPTDWAPREVTVTVGQDDDGENEVVTLDHAASGGHFDRVYGRLRVEITDDDAGRVTPTPMPTPTPAGTPTPTPTPTPPPALPTAPSDSEQTLTLDGRTVTITRQAGSLAGVSVALPSALTRDLEITIAPLLAGIPLSSERFGLGMTAAAQSGATLTVVGVPAGGLEICLPVSQSLVSEAGARSLTLVRYGGAGWEALPDAARRGMSVCAAGVSTGVFAAAYIIPPPPMLGPASDLTATPGADPGTLILRWTPGQDATHHWIAGIKQSDLTANNTAGIIWTAASASDTHTLTGLESGAEYAFAIAAGRGSEWSAWTALARGTPD